MSLAGPDLVRSPDEVGAWLLATVAEKHGVAVATTVLRETLAGASELRLADLARAATAAGFETKVGRLPSYDALVRCTRLPAIVHLHVPAPGKVVVLRGGELVDVGRAPCFAVLLRATNDEVELATFAASRVTVPRGEFEEGWRGVILFAIPGPDIRPVAAATIARRLHRLAVAPAPVKTALASGGTLGLAALAGSELCPGAPTGPTLAALAIALGGSAWALGATKRCAACREATALVGHELAPIGVLVYVALLACVSLVGPTPVVGVAVCALAGVHAGLLELLGRLRVRCGPCSVTALAALTAAGILLGAGRTAGALGALAIVPSFAATWLFVRLRAWRGERRHRAELASIRRLLLEEPAPPPDRLKLIVFELEGCRHCRTLEEAVLPPLEVALGERLAIERRRATTLTAPTVLVVGADRGAHVGLPSLADLRELVAPHHLAQSRL